MCLLDMISIELVPTAPRRRHSSPTRTALRQLRVAHFQVEPTRRDVELDYISSFHQSERSASCSLWRHMQDHCAVGRAAHASVGDTYHVGDAFTQHLRWQGHVAYLGHARIPTRSAVLEHHDAVLIDV